MKHRPPSDKVPQPSSLTSRRRFLRCFAAGMTSGLSGLVATSSGCVPRSTAHRLPERVWGRRGLSDGRLMKPRAMTIDKQDQIYIVDMTGRIQIYDVDGNYLRGWRTPMIAQGKPTGLGMAANGQLIVADTHYFRVLFYDADGRLDETRIVGGEHGDAPGQFNFVTDVAEDARGHIFVGQYGQIDRIQEFDSRGQFVRFWGSQGAQPGQFSRPQALLFDRGGFLWVADACNHRIQVFDVNSRNPQLVDIWGRPGSSPGDLQYPYGLDFDQDGNLLVAEFGNHRVQRFTPAGQLLEAWGQVGSEVGLFDSPWALQIDSQNKLHVLDTMNHRIQRFQLSG